MWNPAYCRFASYWSDQNQWTSSYGDAPAEHVARGSRALLDGVLPVLHSHLAIEDWMIVIRDVTGGVNTADVGLAILVDDDAVVQVDTATFEHLHRWLDADANDDEVALETQACLGDDGGYPPGSFERGHRVFEDGANSVTAMKVSDGLADRFAEQAEERRCRWVDRDHVQTFLPKRRRDLRTDEPHADDDGSTAGNHLLRECDRRPGPCEVRRCLRDRSRESRYAGFARLWR